MKKNARFNEEKLGAYIVFSNKSNSKHIAIFKNSVDKIKSVKIKTEIKEEFIKENKSQKNKFDRYIEHSQLTEYKLNERAIHKIASAEDMFLENDGERKIIKEIWNLPTPQNRRVYMRIVDGFSITEIAKIEERAIPVVKRNIDRGIVNLQKKLIFFYDRGKK